MGPKVKTVVGVVSDLMFFLVILLPFMVGFGVATQSVTEFEKTIVFHNYFLKNCGHFLNFTKNIINLMSF